MVWLIDTYVHVYTVQEKCKYLPCIPLNTGTGIGKTTVRISPETETNNETSTGENYTPSFNKNRSILLHL